ncbi:MAG: DUF3540 domain-containing protein [Polyangiaceae bacterium]
MSAAKKLLGVEAYLETGTVTRAGAAHGRGEDLEVTLATGTFPATIAKSCLVHPDVGDKVLCAVDSDGVYVVAVLTGRAGATTKIAVQGDLQMSATGRASVRGADGVELASAGPVAITGPEVHVRAQTGTVAVEDLGFFGKLVQAEVTKVALVAREVDSIVTRLSQRAKRVFRFVEEIDQTRAGTVDLRAQSLLGLRGETAVISARVLAKVDGEQIHIG